MTDNQITSFIRVVEVGSINRAARELFISAPSLLQRLNNLEAEVGFTLLERDSHGVRPTPAGRRFYECARECARIMGATLASERAALLDGAPTEVRVGEFWRAPRFIADAFHLIRERQAHVKVALRKVEYADCADELHRGELDVIPTLRSTRLDERGLTFTTLGYQDLYCALTPGDPLLGRDRLDPDTLEGTHVFVNEYYRALPALAADAAIARFLGKASALRTPVSTDTLISDCLNATGAVIMVGSRVPDICPPLEARPLEAPRVEWGVYTAGTPTGAITLVVDAIAEAFAAQG